MKKVTIYYLLNAFFMVIFIGVVAWFLFPSNKPVDNTPRAFVSNNSVLVSAEKAPRNAEPPKQDFLDVIYQHWIISAVVCIFVIIVVSVVRVGYKTVQALNNMFTSY